jgi:hypothetical protein
MKKQVIVPRGVKKVALSGKTQIKVTILMDTYYHSCGSDATAKKAVAELQKMIKDGSGSTLSAYIIHPG